MKNNDQLDAYVQRRLEEWGEWYSRDSNYLGYSRRNIIARLKDEGGVIINSTCPASGIINVNADEIEKLYSYLFKQNKKRADVLRIYYHYPYEHEIKAKQNGYSRTQFYHYLQLAHEWLKGYFSAKKKILI